MPVDDLTADADRIEHRSLPTLVVWIVTLAGIALVGVLDYATGFEYRVYPVYYLPLGFAAWHLGRRGTIAAATLCDLSWLLTNYDAGLHYSAASVWVFNVITQGGSFVFVGLLIVSVRRALRREATLGRVDALTSLLNRRAFYEEAQRIFARGQRHGDPVTLAYIDLDDFKTINDTEGHERGDALLRYTADTIRASVRLGDVSARLGGDEFVILLPETHAAGARAVVDRVRAALSVPRAGASRPIATSIGIVSCAAPPEDVETLVREADATMYEAKAAGKNQVAVRVLDGERAPVWSSR